MAQPAAAHEAISDRELGRALLARQGLLERTEGTPLAMIEHLVGLQAQAPRAAYGGLWARLRGFDPLALERLMLERAAVRIVTMRSTIHLHSAADALTLRPLMQAASERATRHSAERRAAGVDETELARRGRDLLHRRPRSLRELGAALQQHWPECPAEALAQGVRSHVPLVQTPPRGLWTAGGEPVLADAERYLGRPLDPQPDLDAVVRRYLAAFGPASVRDAQAWMGVTRLKPAFERLRPELLILRSGTGVELFDLPEAPRPGADVPASARILPEFDNAILGHADRSRIFPTEVTSLLSMANGLRPAFLVDGMVAGMWGRDRGPKGAVTLDLTPLGRLTRAKRAELESEAHAFLAFAELGDGARNIRFIDLE